MEFKLRPWTEKDLPHLVKHANNFNIAKMLTDKFPHPYTLESGKFFLKLANQFDPPQILAIDIEGEAVGALGLHPQSGIQIKNAELGYWLSEDHWGQGIISRAIPQIVDYGFKILEVDRIFARPFGHNIASQRVLEKAGFKFEARFEKSLYKCDEYVDELFYAVRRRDWK
ncbi:MAG: GNAT family protein [Bacteroidota bacterium]